MPQQLTVNLSGVPETTLWTLHNRANEAMGPHGLLDDPEAVRIYQSIDYDFIGMFGQPDGTHAMRSHLIDQWLRQWMTDHPGATVVELACGLETQFQRCDDGRVEWLCIDLPELIEVRRQVLPPDERCIYIEQDAFDLSWTQRLNPIRPVFISAAGLLMYYPEAKVRQFIVELYEKLSDVIFVFDTVPPWFSRKTIKGFAKTPNYQLPPLPWGISHAGLDSTLKCWAPNIIDVQSLPYGPTRGPLKWFTKFLKVPGLINLAPLVVRAASIG